jgi:single-strand DNA-binding protein
VINSVVLVGRLTRDPELTYTQSGTALCKFGIAVDRPPRQGATEDETDFLNVVAWGRVAETTAQYLDKGSLVGIEGRIQSRSWERTDGSGRAYAVEINAARVHFLESRQERERRQAASGGGGPRPPQQQRPPQRDQAAPPPQQQQGGSDIDWAMDEEEDPFGDQ